MIGRENLHRLGDIAGGSEEELMHGGRDKLELVLA
jgi:hypothetical protein